MSRKVFRVVVDSYPTSDGKPFIDQPWQWWEEIVERNLDPSSHPGENPAWVPDLTDATWIDGVGDWGHPTRDSPSDKGAYIESDVGDPFLVVPALKRRHFFARHAAQTRVNQFLVWGAIARVESAEIGEWS